MVTWFRVTGLGWLIATPMTVSLNAIVPTRTLVSTYLLPVTLMGFTLVAAGQLLGCDTKRYGNAVALSMWLVVALQVVQSSLTDSASRAVAYLVTAFLLVVLIVHGSLELRRAAGWGSAQLLGAITVIVWGLASELGSISLQNVVGDTLPALLLTSAASAGLFAFVFEGVQHSETVPTRD